jgi:hypothetical protein
VLERQKGGALTDEDAFALGLEAQRWTRRHLRESRAKTKEAPVLRAALGANVSGRAYVRPEGASGQVIDSYVIRPSSTCCRARSPRRSLTRSPAQRS